MNQEPLACSAAAAPDASAMEEAEGLYRTLAQGRARALGDRGRGVQKGP